MPKLQTRNECAIRFKELSTLPSVEFDKQRKPAAKELNIRVSTLDKEVDKLRKPEEPTTLDVVENLEPWEQPVSGLDLFNKIESMIKRHVVMYDGMETVVALWVMGTYCINEFPIFPKLLVKSPEPQCGKTTLIETIEGLVYKSYVANNITASALFRVIDKYQPTILIDEADLFLKDDPELNGIINCGHKKRTATVTRNVKVNNDFEPRKFDVWCAQVIAGIGSQRDTLRSRSIEVYLRRRLHHEIIKKIPMDFYESNKALRRMCLRWALDNAAKLRSQFVEAPPCGNDRRQDNFSPIFSIAKIIDDDVSGRLRKIYDIPLADENESAGLMLLSDIQSVLNEYAGVNISSRYLVDKLVGMEDRPWFESRKGKPITQNTLAKLLAPYRLKSTKVRIGEDSLRGFHVSDFSDAFNRYLAPLPPKQSGTVEQSRCNAGCGSIQNGTQKNDVPLQNPLKPALQRDCSTVPLQNGGYEVEGTIRQQEEI